MKWRLASLVLCIAVGCTIALSRQAEADPSPVPVGTPTANGEGASTSERLGLPLAASPPAPIGDYICGWKSKTKPDPLTGSEGGASSDYRFSHSSDVEQQGQKNQFAYLIQNDHTTLLLPAGWERESGEVVVRFERIAPGGCASNTVESLLVWDEDPCARIKYGPTAQHSRKASLFFAKTAPALIQVPGPAVTDAPALGAGSGLTSRISVDHEDEDKVRYPIELELTSEATEKQQLRYTMLNRGPKEQVFVIPELSSDRVSQITGAKVTTRWESLRRGDEELFVIQADGQATFALDLAAGVRSEETIVGIQLRDAHGRAVAIGRATVHLPRRGQ